MRPFYQTLKGVELPYEMRTGNGELIARIETETQRKNWIRHYRSRPRRYPAFTSGPDGRLQITEAARRRVRQAIKAEAERLGLGA